MDGDTARSIDDKRDHDDEHQRRTDGMQAKGDGPPAVDRAMRQHVLQSNLNERNALEPLTIWFVLRGARVTVLLLR